MINQEKPRPLKPWCIRYLQILTKKRFQFLSAGYYQTRWDNSNTSKWKQEKSRNRINETNTSTYDSSNGLAHVFCMFIQSPALTSFVFKKVEEDQHANEVWNGYVYLRITFIGTQLLQIVREEIYNALWVVRVPRRSRTVADQPEQLKNVTNKKRLGALINFVIRTYKT